MATIVDKEINNNKLVWNKKFLGNKNHKSERDTRQLRPSF